MTSSPTVDPATELPIQRYLAELVWLRKYPELSVLFDTIDELRLSLETLSDSISQLPDLSGNTWFLRQHFLSVSEQISGTLHATIEQMKLLGTIGYADGDPFEITAFIEGFMSFAEQAKASPALFQQPFEMAFRPSYPAAPPHEEAPKTSGRDLDWLTDIMG